MFENGEYVVYGCGEVCKVENTVCRCFDGVNKSEYYTLSPIQCRGSAYYVPVKNAEKSMRRVLTRAEVINVIDGIPLAEEVWYADKNKRRDYYASALKSGSPSVIISIIKSVYKERERRGQCGKQLIAEDEKAFRTAEHILHGEIAFVLGIGENEVGEFIHNRLNSLC